MNISQLRLDQVKALLEQGGQHLPEPNGAGDAAFVQSLLDALCEMTLRDPLTGVMNRRALMVELSQELDRVVRSGESALLLMVDVDHFKLVNDQHGHVAGDSVLRAVGLLLTESVRPMDSVARFGGEEFALIFPDCPMTLAETVAERIRARIEALRVPHQELPPLQVTVSCGGAFALAWSPTTVEDWIARADAQMYRAKSGGRNRVCIEPMPVSNVSAEEKGMLFGLTPGDTGMMSASAPARRRSTRTRS